MGIITDRVGSLSFEMKGNFDGAKLIEYSEPDFRLVSSNEKLYCVSTLLFTAEGMNTDARLSAHIQQAFVLVTQPTPELVYKSFLTMSDSLQVMVNQVFKYHSASLVVKLPALEEIRPDIISRISFGSGSV